MAGDAHIGNGGCDVDNGKVCNSDVLAWLRLKAAALTWLEPALAFKIFKPSHH